MSVLDALITDRTAADVAEVKDLHERANAGDSAAAYQLKTESLKGAYNAQDLNRVGTACAYLYALITDLGYAVDGYTALRTDWAIVNVPTEAEMTTYLSTVAALKAVFSAAQSVPASMNALTYDGANNIEKLFLEIDNIMKRLSAIYIRSGAWNAYSGTGFYIKN